ncbi:hypothetical protein PVAP13_6NG244630 [Panicum virgatum]|uniref:Uncharacterized protein n=1 Tax=Panicum virgatum TaxID=38727 RepID=A0A8T0R145_PANVG|nr:hypothetical protein PVAP13_6NG244630 [Panicum virgatum]
MYNGNYYAVYCWFIVIFESKPGGDGLCRPLARRRPHPVAREEATAWHIRCSSSCKMITATTDPLRVRAHAPDLMGKYDFPPAHVRHAAPPQPLQAKPRCCPRHARRQPLAAARRVRRRRQCWPPHQASLLPTPHSPVAARCCLPAAAACPAMEEGGQWSMQAREREMRG